MELHNTLLYQVAQETARFTDMKDAKVFHTAAFICALHGISPDMLFGGRKFQNLVEARFTCFYLLKKEYKMTHQYIASFWGYNTDCITRGLQSLRNWMDVTPEVETKVEETIESLRKFNPAVC